TPVEAIDSEPQLGTRTLTTACQPGQGAGGLAACADTHSAVNRARHTGGFPSAPVPDPVASCDRRDGGRRTSICSRGCDARVPMAPLCDPTSSASPRHGTDSLGGRWLRRTAAAGLRGGCGPGADTG